MARTGIVTDSTSGLSPEEAGPLGIAIIPMRIDVGGHVYREGVDIAQSDFYQLVGGSRTVPSTEPPTVREFHELFRRVGREAHEVIAILVSSQLSATVSVARQAAQSFPGRARITVIDSRLAALPLGWLATAAAEAAAAGVDTPEIVRLIRAMIPRMYLAFFVEDLDYLRQSGLSPRAPAITTITAATKPLLMLEEGEIMVLERSRSRGRAVERLFEFIMEFRHLERIAILQGRPLPESIELATLLNEEMPEEPVETRIFPASVAAHVGVDALGVAIYEGL